MNRMRGNYDWLITLTDGSEEAIWRESDPGMRKPGHERVGSVYVDAFGIWVDWKHGGRSRYPWSAVRRFDEQYAASMVAGPSL